MKKVKAIFWISKNKIIKKKHCQINNLLNISRKNKSHPQTKSNYLPKHNSIKQKVCPILKLLIKAKNRIIKNITLLSNQLITVNIKNINKILYSEILKKIKSSKSSYTNRKRKIILLNNNKYINNKRISWKK